jgi:osmotically-inducible protein OsmY
MKATQALSLIMVSAVLLMFSVTVQASELDERIESSAKQSYVFKNYLKDGDDIKVKSKDGAVTLTGTVTEDSHKDLAGETVANINGVKSVDNKLSVKGERPAEKSDAWLMTKVKTTLLFHRSVSGLQTEVVVKDGVATLRGEADNLAQKDLTTEYVRDIEGIKDVINEMTIAKAPKEVRKDVDKKADKAEAKSSQETRSLGDKIDDASITALVKTSLLYHRSTSGLKTKVETKDGIVTLSGKANNAAELYLASKLAKDVNGVNDVKNLMTIE